MTGRLALGLGLALLVVGAVGAEAQTFSPQSASGLNVTFSTERLGPTRVLIFGEVTNGTNTPANRVILLAEGLDETGRVVSRARGYVPGLIPARNRSTFEIRLSAAGSERRYRVQVEAFEFIVGGQ
ncbi:MAG TPA: hypothetical protein VFO18_01960 [Methylomirabilota bacterium]|nr:hypothetical protein [Methylomirabilota bacterium]